MLEAGIEGHACVATYQGNGVQIRVRKTQKLKGILLEVAQGGLLQHLPLTILVPQHLHNTDADRLIGTQVVLALELVGKGLETVLPLPLQPGSFAEHARLISAAAGTKTNKSPTSEVFKKCHGSIVADRIHQATNATDPVCCKSPRVDPVRLVAAPPARYAAGTMPSRTQARIRLILQIVPIIVVAVAGVIGASQLSVVREFFARASGEPANLVIDAGAPTGAIRQPWRNLAQGGEMSDWRLTPIAAKVKALQPEYIRIDHIYSFYDIVQKNGDQLSFNFSKLDPLIDDIVATGARPYISLSYMPAPLAVDGQITSPPARWEDWQATVRATIQHYSGTKGIDSVYYEVWNEPDLFGQWKTYGERNYLTLYTYAAQGAAQTSGTKAFKIGGPAITALYKNWFDKLVEHTRTNNLRLDFFSWHKYAVDVEAYRKDFADVLAWRGSTPGAEMLELHVTEYGHDSKNHPGYDTSFGAAHTVATAIEMIGSIDRGFAFEIEDGKDPQGQAQWGRWGLLTHHDFGATIKPRYLAMRLLNRLEGDQLRVLGKGTWVKAAAVRSTDGVNMVIVNYDEFGRNTEEVPITLQNVAAGSYTMEITDLSGGTRRLPLTTEGTTLRTTLPTRAGDVYFVAFRPTAPSPLP